MRILNQTAYPEEWLRERVEFGLRRAWASGVRVLPSRDQHPHGTTTFASRGPTWAAKGGRIDIRLPLRLSHARIRRYSPYGMFLGRLTQAEALVYLIAHEAEHTQQADSPRTHRERHNGPETCADKAGVARLRQWLYPALKG